MKVTHTSSIITLFFFLFIPFLINLSLKQEFFESFEITDEPSPDTIYSIDDEYVGDTNPEIKECNYLIKN